MADADVPSGHELPSTTTTTTVRSTKEGKEGGNLPELLKRHADHDEKSHSIHFFGCCFNFAEEGTRAADEAVAEQEQDVTEESRR